MNVPSGTGGFTLPGEAGYEGLTLELARRWGADVIRDSDGTTLSHEILDAGYGIYSTICPIREHNDWINRHPAAQQQTFLCTAPKTAVSGPFPSQTLRVSLMEGFFDGQFKINDTPEGLKYWQVYDRTTDMPVDRSLWHYDAESGTVEISATPWRQYTVSFLAWRCWEEISMYNHVTNHWDKEHLQQLNPYDVEARAYLQKYMDEWCLARPQTTVVRFTSLFYNFAWIWGADSRNRYLFADWASYDFTVCPEALDDFERSYGYALTAEDFVRQGKYNATHRVPSAQKRDWITFISRIVRETARELIDIVHRAGKLAYVFYDDSWLGLEPYNGHFEEFGFDGIIKCVFSGYEARLCANVPAPVHEIRFHPYLFPVGLGGAPTFSEGGRPGDDAKRYWISVRRALLRQRIERCGLGGYLHLVRDYPDFTDAMDGILREFRLINTLHDAGEPYCVPLKIAVLHAWGSLRTWTLSGHFHETDGHMLIHVLESLSGLPFEVSFISFEDVKNGGLHGVDVIINAGLAGDAWSGGACWQDNTVVETVTQWVYEGGVFLGIGEPSASEGHHHFLRLAHVLGVDIDRGERTCHGKWSFDVSLVEGLIPSGADIPSRAGAHLTDGNAHVLAGDGGVPTVTVNGFGKGKGCYCAGFTTGPLATVFLRNLLLFAAMGDKGENAVQGLTDDPYVECAVYPQKGQIAFINNAAEPRSASCIWNGSHYRVSLEPFEMKLADIT